MSRISDIIFCMEAESIEGSGVTAHKILTALNPEYVPGLFSFSIVITIIDLDYSKGHKLQICFFDPSEEKVFEVNGDTPIIEDDSNLPNEYKGLNIAMSWNNVNFKVSGIYKVKIFVDDVELGDKSIFVKGKND